MRDRGVCGEGSGKDGWVLIGCVERVEGGGVRGEVRGVCESVCERVCCEIVCCERGGL